MARAGMNMASTVLSITSAAAIESIVDGVHQLSPCADGETMVCMCLCVCVCVCVLQHSQPMFKLIALYLAAALLLPPCSTVEGGDLQHKPRQQLRKLNCLQDAREDVDMTADSVLSEVASKVGKTKFVGYDSVRVDKACVRAILRNGKEVAEVEEGERADMVLDVTPFYAESGGQIGDRGDVQVCVTVHLPALCQVQYSSIPSIASPHLALTPWRHLATCLVPSQRIASTSSAATGTAS
jgi:hypothetical protein